MESIPISVYGRDLTSVFQLLGSKENNITYSLGWAIARAPTLRARLAGFLGVPEKAFEQVRLQEHGTDHGFTDIELLGPDVHVIVEAKRGWWLPTDLQFCRYAPRFAKFNRRFQFFLGMSDCWLGYAELHLPASVSGVQLRYLGWRDVELLAATGRSHAEKRLLAELRIYLRSVATMQNTRSNLVFVVSIAGGFPTGASTSWVDIVEKLGQYFHPVGHRWPPEPPNYIAFRYGGQLRSIHHIDGFVVTTCIGNEVDGMPTEENTKPHFVYKLGPAIRPAHIVKNGASVQRSARIWAMLDLLLTCDTLTDAWRQTNLRLGTANVDCTPLGDGNSALLGD